MEAKSRRRTRRPLSDCTNSIDSLNTSQSSSTSTKHSSSIIKPSKFLPTTTTKPTETQKQSTTGCTPQNDNPPSNPSTVSLSTPPRAGNFAALLFDWSFICGFSTGIFYCSWIVCLFDPHYYELMGFGNLALFASRSRVWDLLFDVSVVLV